MADAWLFINGEIVPATWRGSDLVPTGVVTDPVLVPASQPDHEHGQSDDELETEQGQNHDLPFG